VAKLQLVKIASGGGHSTQRTLFKDILGWRGDHRPITAVVTDLSDARDVGCKKAVALVAEQ
jgi:hypothetical protein